MAAETDDDPTKRPHPQVRLDNHDERLTQLERFKEQAKGGLLVLSFLVGSGAFTAFLVNIIL
jgi:hypothetical protein